jgi:hypothetical protein
MRYTIELREGYLRGELIERETPGETAEFGAALQAALRDNGVSRMLVVVRASRPIFRVEEYQLSELFRRLGDVAGLRIALVADSAELAAAHQYVELIAGQKGIALRSFAGEKPALEWLLA